MSYDFFSRWYDALTDMDDYSERADYFCSLLSLYGVKSGIILDVGCGTGTMCLHLAGQGYEVIGVDVSTGMLSVAREKCSEQGDKILLLNQDMRSLDLYGTVDGAVCMLDGLNHLPSGEDILRALRSISLFMNPGGVFIFDVNTVYKHSHVLSDNTFVIDDEENGVYCVWQNSFNEDDNSVDIALDFFEKQEDGRYCLSREDFSEIACSREELEKMLSDAGFDVLACFDDLSNEAPREDSEKLIFVAKKRNNK